MPTAGKDPLCSFSLVIKYAGKYGEQQQRVALVRRLTPCRGMEGPVRMSPEGRGICRVHCVLPSRQYAVQMEAEGGGGIGGPSLVVLLEDTDTCAVSKYEDHHPTPPA